MSEDKIPLDHPTVKKKPSQEMRDELAKKMYLANLKLQEQGLLLNGQRLHGPPLPPSKISEC